MLVATAVPSLAQETVWVQVEAQPTLAAAQTRVRAYAARLENVNGYYLGSGWYGIALGPYSRDDAETLVRQLRRAGEIPADSFVATGNRFQQQFWPIGVGAQTTAQALPEAPQATEVVEQPVTVTQLDGATQEIAAVDPVVITPVIEEPVITEPVIIAPDETAAEARASEAALNRAEREELQIGLQWAGFYNAAIDGAFGRGTRQSMTDWQIANNYEPTGILTTAQRAALLGAYNAVLEGMGIQLIRDAATGIELKIPTGVVAFSAYEPPFARFDAKGDLGAQVLLISQEGDQNRLFGLYEILQTLAIVPTEGPRNRRDDSFEIEGVGGGIHSYITATLADGAIKGFALIWPEGDDDRRRRVLGQMQTSFATFPGTLDPALSVPGEDQAIDLIAGLEVRKPRLSRSGFFVDPSGTVLTTAEAVESCEKITLNSEHDASIAYLDADRGLAVLKPTVALAPLGVAAFQIGVPRLQAEVAVAGFPYGEVLVNPSLTFGRLADLRGLNGEETIKRLALTALPGDAGGPVFDNGGAVLGMLLPKVPLNGQVLPSEVSFAMDADEILASLSNAGVAAQTTDTVAFMPPETLTLRAADSTVLVSCW